ncbi:hypothetical protein [Streptomyces sp. V4I2]|uniref:hypothetical protein n=1 Tax=Streptomyces sp. V4I2 TaxID=3042280 RepID=UPI0027849CC1|nr:hypothetical protein [Streptomyces sp. V4I2]MDQ1042481.1 hypothetical protein [Streptomyces sp. V4I2]
MVLSTEDAARLVRQATRRRADGSRGMRARWAWRQLLRACAQGDPVAQEALRTAELPAPDVLDLLAAAPEEPTDQAAYLTLIGQHAQRQALDPDGSLLALAYRATRPQIRERLRTALATAGDSTAIRVVITGDRRDRLATLSYDEADYLSRQLAHHHDWDELRRLATDLPLAAAATAAGLLPPHERTGRHAAALTLLAGQPVPGLRALTERLPADRLVRYDVGKVHEYHHVGASFSPDLSELAVVRASSRRPWSDYPYQFDLHTLRVGSDNLTHRRRWIRNARSVLYSGALHLGDEILVQIWGYGPPEQIVRTLPDKRVFELPEPAVSIIRRASGGAVMLGPEGLVFADRGAKALRYQPIPGFQRMTGPKEFAAYVRSCALATLPSARLIAFRLGTSIRVVDEDGRPVHQIPARLERAEDEVTSHGLLFRAPNTLAVRYGKHIRTWEFSPQSAKRVPDVPVGPFQWTPETSSPFAQSHGTWFGWDVADQSPWGDIQALTTVVEGQARLEVVSPHLPTARELLRQPPAHADPQQLRRVRELLPKIGDPTVRDALDVLRRCLEERFGHDIALGPAGPVPAGGPTDIALARHPDQPQGDA